MENIKIAVLKNKIKKMSRNSYLSLCERIELRNTAELLKRLEQHEGDQSPSLLSLF
jgi:hypothetical protein